jgi:hypothetical protein
MTVLTAFLIVALVLVLIAGFALALWIMNDGGIISWIIGQNVLSTTLEIAGSILTALLK